MRIRLAVVLVALPLVVVLAPAGARADDAPNASDYVLPRDFMPITDEQKALASVPFAPGAPAVVLFDGEQIEWHFRAVYDMTDIDRRDLPGWMPPGRSGGTARPITAIRHRRIKILTQAGMANHSDYDLTLTGEWRVKDIEARTVEPDGTVVDASSGIHREGGDAKDHLVVRVIFPQVRVGSILDVVVTMNGDSLGYEPWVIQEDLPVLVSRIIVAPPGTLKFRTATVDMPPEAAMPINFRLGDYDAHAFEFKDVPPIPDLPNLPAASDIARTLVFIYGDTPSSSAAAWNAFAQLRTDAWDSWWKHARSSSAALATQVAAGATSPKDKAEAIRRALHDRVHVLTVSQWPMKTSPDEVLSDGEGTSADVAGLTIAMLESVGVRAHLAITRRRAGGSLPPNMPAPNLYDDYLVVLPEAGGAPGKDLFYSPSIDAPIGQIPWEISGVLALILAKDVKGPVVVPELAADQNRTDAAFTAHLDEDGTLHAQGAVTRSGVGAQLWRRWLEDLAPDERRNGIQGLLREREAGAEIEALAFEGMQDGKADLVVTMAWHVGGFATRAGGSVLARPFLFEGISRDAWAAEKRDLPVELGAPSETTETVMLTVPEGTTAVTIPQERTIDAGSVGLYETSFKAKARTIMSRRHFRLDSHSFPSSSWSTLRTWYLDMATNDEQPIVITLPQSVGP